MRYVVLTAISFSFSLITASAQSQTRDRYPAPATSPPATAGSAAEASSELPAPVDSRALLEGFERREIPSSTPAATSPPPSTAPPATTPAGSPYQGASPYTPPPTTATPPSTTPAATPPAAVASPQGDARYAKSLMKASLTAPQNSQLIGEAVYLSDVVRVGGSRSDQSERIGAYWDLCSAVADYYLSLHEQAEMERLASRAGQATLPLREAVSRLRTRRDTSLTAARASQLRLASLMRQSNTSVRPLPADMPLCAVYHTRYSQNFPAGGPQEAAELDRLLPLRHAELLGAARSVAEAEDWFEEVARRPSNDQGAGVVKALELLALNRRAFVQISRDYNKRITRYTELAKPGDLRTERLVAMLIKSAGNVASRPPQASSTPNGGRSQSSPPATFRKELANPLRDVAPRIDAEVAPAAATEGHNMVEKIAPGESSVLVRPDAE